MDMFFRKIIHYTDTHFFPVRSRKLFDTATVKFRAQPLLRIQPNAYLLFLHKNSPLQEFAQKCRIYTVSLSRQYIFVGDTGYLRWWSCGQDKSTTHHRSWYSLSSCILNGFLNKQPGLFQIPKQTRFIIYFASRGFLFS